MPIIKAEVSLQSTPSIIRQANSLTTHAENINKNITRVDYVKLAASSEARLFRRAQRWTLKEEELLLKLRSDEELPWNEIVKFMPERT